MGALKAFSTLFQVHSRMLGVYRSYKRALLFGSSFVTGCNFNALFLYNLAMSDPTYLIQNLAEYFTGVMCLALTFHCWRLDRQGRASAVTKGSYVALVCMLFLIMAIPSIGL
jgi:dolichyl-phosphate-mannose--protein O-mannosyl transferase